MSGEVRKAEELLKALQRSLLDLGRENAELHARLQEDVHVTRRSSTAGPSSSSSPKVLVVHGEREGAESDSLRLSLKLNWSLLGMEEPPSGRCWSAACVLQDHVLVQGGYSGSNKYYNDIFYFDSRARGRWKMLQTQGNAPPKLYAHTLDAVGGSLVLMGGGTGRNYQNSVYVLSELNLEAGTGRWEDVTAVFPQIWARRGAHATAVVGEKLYVFGGDNGHGTYFNDLFELDIRSMRIRQLETRGKAPPKRGWHTMSAVDNTLYVFGGTDGSQTFNDIFVLDLDNQMWREPATGGRKANPRYSHSAVVVGSEIMILGGSYEGKSYNDAFVFDTETLCWLHPSMVGDAPSPRYGQVSVLAKDRVFVFGGYSGSSFTQELYMLPLVQNNKDVAQLDPRTINSLIADFRQLVDDSEFADVVFEVEGCQVYGHRNILAQRCDHFARMFRSGMREGSSGTPGDPVVIPVREITYDAFCGVIQFLYSGFCPLGQESAQELLAAADRFGVADLKGRCESWLIQRVNITNVLEMVLLADRYHAMRLRDNCLRYIRNNRDLLLADDEVASHPDLQVIFVETAESRNC